MAVCGTAVDANRLERAAELGAALTIDVEKEDAVEIIKAHTNGYGADIVLECSGAEPAASLGIELVRKRGKYTHRWGCSATQLRLILSRLPLRNFR